MTTIAAASNWPLAIEWTLAGVAALAVGAWLLARFLRRVGRRTLWKHRRHIDRYIELKSVATMSGDNLQVSGPASSAICGPEVQQ